MPWNSIDLSGQRFGRLVAIGRDTTGTKVRWICICDCGGNALVQTTALKQRTRSCGCLVAEATRAANTKHGMRGTPEYRAWAALHNRCANPRNKDFANYGGRGITVDPRWNDFSAFFADMGMRPSASHSIDRRDNDRGYEPGNCRWATAAEQARNRRTRSRNQEGQFA